MVAGLLPGCTYLFPAEEESLAPPLVEPEEVTYQTEAAAKKSIKNELRVSVSFAPSLFEDVIFPYSGRLAELTVREGQDVAAGDVLASFDTEGVETRIRNQQFAVEKARLNVQQRKASKASSEFVFATADGKVMSIHAKPGDDSAQVTSTWGNLMSIMDEGRMSVTVKGLEKKMNAGEGVLVQRPNGGSSFTGRISEVQNNMEIGNRNTPGYRWNGDIVVEFDGRIADVLEGDQLEVYSTREGFLAGTGEAVLVGQTLVKASGGIIEEVYVSEGQSVVTGERLLKLKGDDFSIRNAEIDLAQAQATLADYELERERTRVLAPITGRVSWVGTFNINDFINSYTDLCRIADPSSLALEYRGDKASQFTLGMVVTCVLGKSEYQAEVVANPSSLPREKNGAQQNIARFRIKELPLEGVEYGQGGYVTAILAQKDDVLVLSKDRVQSFWGRKYVNVLEDGLKVEKDVEIGIETSTEVEVVKGLNEGDLIITR